MPQVNSNMDDLENIHERVSRMMKQFKAIDKEDFSGNCDVCWEETLCMCLWVLGKIHKIIQCCPVEEGLVWLAITPRGRSGINGSSWGGLKGLRSLVLNGFVWKFCNRYWIEWQSSTAYKGRPWRQLVLLKVKQATSTHYPWEVHKCMFYV